MVVVRDAVLVRFDRTASTYLTIKDLNQPFHPSWSGLIVMKAPSTMLSMLMATSSGLLLSWQSLVA